MTEMRSLPLTDLSDDEKTFREVVRDFAEEQIRPLVRQMDEASSIPRELIDACFALGIMGEYQARMHFRTMERPAYAVRERTDRNAVP